MTAPLHVLLVEDSENDAELVRLHLERAGWQVELRRIETRAQMLGAFLGKRWDIVLADHSLPTFDASRALGVLHEVGDDVPLIVVSGTIGEARAVELMRLGARDFVLKDDLARLTPAISRELREAENRRMRRTAERQREDLIGRLRRALDHADQLNASLEEVQRAKDQFLATVSHELRTPLTAILGWARIASSSELDQVKSRKAMSVIERNAQTMSQLVEDLLDFSAFSRGQVGLRLTAVDLSTLVAETLDTLVVAAQSRDIAVTRRVEDGAVRVCGDATRLQQVVWNLVSNALKFTRKGGRVEVALSRSSRFIELAVSDDGQGISREFLPHVFEPFRQADGTTTRTHGGLGLGLSIVRQLVELHGGTIGAESEGDGLGSRFMVRLPIPTLWEGTAEGSAEQRREGDPSEPPPAALASAGLEDAHVVVVDSETGTRERLASVLRAAKARVTPVAGPSDAIAALDAGPVSALLVSVGAVVDSAHALVRQVRARPWGEGGQVPALALALLAKAEDRRRSLEAGFTAHLTKPVSPAELVPAVREVCRSAFHGQTLA